MRSPSADLAWREAVRHSEHFYCWMLHQPRVATLVDEGRAPWHARLRRSIGRAHVRDVDRTTRELQQWLRRHEVPSLELLLIQGRPTIHQLVWIEAPFQWSDVADERRQLEHNSDARSTFSTRLDSGDDGTEICGSFSPRHCTCSSANVELSGVRSQYILGTVAEESSNQIEIRPLAIADRLLGTLRDPRAEVERQQVFPRQVDQFAAIDFDDDVTLDDLKQLARVPEEEIKRTLAALVGEPVVPKDWGGEQMDLWTTRLLVDGRQTSAAFLLKGKSAFRPMTIDVLGRRGDQIDRMADTAAELLVLQHCHEVTPRVVSMLRAYASDYRNPRRYLVIDGFDTFRILRAAGRL